MRDKYVASTDPNRIYPLPPHLAQVKCVASTQEAVAHINDHGSHHTDSIVSRCESSIAHFQVA